MRICKSCGKPIKPTDETERAVIGVIYKEEIELIWHRPHKKCAERSYFKELANDASIR